MTAAAASRWDESGKPQHPWPSVQHLFRNPSSLRPGYIVKVLKSGILVIDQIQTCSIQQPIEICYTQCSETCKYFDYCGYYSGFGGLSI